MAKPKTGPYGYGIVDKDGMPWWDEACVCQDRGPMQETVDNLNDDRDNPDDRCPYRVVRLVWEKA